MQDITYDYAISLHWKILV